MSSWTYIIAETSDESSFRSSIEKSLEPYEQELSEHEPKKDEPSRVRYNIGGGLLQRQDGDKAESDSKSTHDFAVNLIETGQIEPVEWAVVLSGNDTSSSGKVHVFEGTEQIDVYRGKEGRLAHDVAAYLEQFHGVLVAPLPSKMDWINDHRYDPSFDLQEADPQQTLASNGSCRKVL
jgi:hypothetical protein